MKINKTNLLIALLTTLLVGLTSPQMAFAKCQTSIMGVPTWYRGLVNSNCEIKQINNAKDGLSLKVFVTTVIINIGDMMVRVIGIASALFIIFGGFKYVLSAGEESKIAAAKKTISRAVTGLMLSLMSVGIVNFVFGLFTYSNKVQSGDSSTIQLANQADQNVIFAILLPQLFTWLGIAAVFMITVGGAQYILAAGDATKVTTAKKTIKYSVVGLVVALLSFAIVKIVAGLF